MDHLKQALKNKMGKVINIKISLDDASDDLKDKTDMAPEVQDSDEPGVEKDQPMHGLPGGFPHPQLGQAMHNPEVANSLISQAPDHPAGGKTLDSIAKERAIKRMSMRK